MGPKQVLPLWVKVDLGVMAMKGYSSFPKGPELEPHHQILEGYYSSAEMQSLYSTGTANCAISLIETGDNYIELVIFASASHQTRLDTWSVIKGGLKGWVGRERVETQTLLVYAGH